MGVSIAKMQIGLVGAGDRLVVLTRTTRYLLTRGAVGFILATNNPSKKSGVVEVVGAMDTRTGAIDHEVLEVGKYMVFRHGEESEEGVKTSLVIRIEIDRKS